MEEVEAGKRFAVKTLKKKQEKDNKCTSILVTHQVKGLPLLFIFLMVVFKKQHFFMLYTKCVFSGCWLELTARFSLVRFLVLKFSRSFYGVII